MEELSLALRPVAPPQRLEATYSDSDFRTMIDLIRRHGPWDLIIKTHFSSIEELAASIGASDTRSLSLNSFVTQAFRGYLGHHGVCYHDEVHDLFYNKGFMSLARQYWGGAKYAQPYQLMFNLQAPSHCFDRGHLDSPGFRGMWGQDSPIWLLSSMARSGLFKRWMLKTAQVISWYYASDLDGGFTYWPDGPFSSPQRLPAPMWGSGVVVQNELNYHRGEASGPKALRDLPAGFTFDSTIAGDPESDGWLIRTGDQILRRVAHQDMRYLFHWSTEVFSDMADMKRRLDHLDDITPERAIEMLVDDMRRRKVPVAMPSDPLHDRQFIELVGRTYFVSPTHYPDVAPPDLPA